MLLLIVKSSGTTFSLWFWAGAAGDVEVRQLPWAAIVWMDAGLTEQTRDQVSAVCGSPGWLAHQTTDHFPGDEPLEQ